MNVAPLLVHRKQCEQLSKVPTQQKILKQIRKGRFDELKTYLSSQRMTPVLIDTIYQKALSVGLIKPLNQTDATKALNDKFMKIRQICDSGGLDKQDEAIQILLKICDEIKFKVAYNQSKSCTIL